jgi:hypothetical protein
MQTRAALRHIPWPVRIAIALAAALTFANLPHVHGLACAHDLSGLCVDAEIGPGDATDKGNYPFEAASATDGAASEFSESSNVEVLAHLDPGTGFNADVVVHRRTAYMGSWGNLQTENCPAFGVRAFDLSNPREPVHVSTFADGAAEPDLAGTWTEKVIVERFRGRDLAAVSMQHCRTDGFGGWGLYDVTDPANPERLALVPSAAQGSHEIWLETRGNRAFVYTAVILSELLDSPDGETPGEPDFQIWDVTDPQEPTKIGEWGAWAELSVEPVFVDDNGVTRVNFVHSVIGAVSGPQHRAYLSYWDLGTVILDVTDPANPELIGRTEFADREEGNAHSAWLARGGNLLVQTDEDFDPAPHDVLETAWGYARFFDISDPGSPQPVGTFELDSTRQFPPPAPGFYTVHDPKVRGRHLFLSYYAEGVVVLDISDPGEARQIAQFVPDPAPDPRGFFFPDESFPNVWGVDLAENYAVASDINSGLWVFRLDHRRVTGVGRETARPPAAGVGRGATGLASTSQTRTTTR